MKLLLSILMLCCLSLNAADVNTARSVKLRGFRGLWLAPTIDWSPTNIAGLFGWWRPESQTNLTDGLKVDWWGDDSGHNLHMKKFSTSPVSTNGILNGYRAVWFDGVNMSLTNAAEMVQNIVIFAVISHRQVGDETVYLLSANSGAISGLTAYWGANNTTNLSIADAGVGMFALGPRTNEFTTFVLQYAGADSKIYTNGVLAGTGSVGPQGMTGGMTVGNYYTATINYLRFYAVEMFCVTNSTATADILQNGCNYLQQKYRHY